jgi:hypothetical protein
MFHYRPSQLIMAQMGHAFSDMDQVKAAAYPPACGFRRI